MKLPEEVTEGALRLGLGKFTTEEEIEKAAEILSAAVSKIRSLICL